MILAPGTDEGGVMVVSTKPRYPADAPSLAFEKKLFEPSLQGESAGCLSSNTMHPRPPRGEYRVFVIKHSVPFLKHPVCTSACFAAALRLNYIHDMYILILQ